jgi:EAL domain-containing protein (putative c-di-GMP-specific phosphodiesterase class I)
MDVLCEGAFLGLEVVAEGVESEAVWNSLAAHESDVAQGYLMSMPIPTGQFLQWKAKSNQALAQYSACLSLSCLS